MNNWRITKWSLAAAVVVTGATWLWNQSLAEDGKPSEAALERTRKNVRMLDDIYKTAVVLITDKYVNKPEDFPAGAAAVALFSAVKEKGWHEVHLLDATGKPYDAKNTPKDEFDKAAVAALVAGKKVNEKVVTVNGKPHLRTATAVPVVSKKCVMCHDHYKDVPAGQAVGIISYTMPVE